ncbi:TorF family putative porin [Desulfarculus baarsii]
MKKLVCAMMLALALLVSAAGAGLAVAEESGPEVTATFDATFNSKYVWRGMLLVDDPVLQPSATVGVGNFSLNVWGDYEFTDVNGRQHEVDEIDITLNYTIPVGDFSIPVGAIVYTFPNGGNDTTELYVGVAYNWIVTPSLTCYYDVDELAGSFYFRGALDYSLDLPEVVSKVSWAAAIGASIGWGNSEYNNGYFGVDESHFSDWSIYASLPISFCKYFTVKPMITYTSLVDIEIRDAGKAIYTEENNFFYGISLSVSF